MMTTPVNDQETSPIHSRREWGGLILETRIEYGKAARKNRGNHAGAKIHRLWTEYVVGLVEGYEPRPGTVGAAFQRTGKPVLFSTHPACGCTMGQYAGMALSQFTEDHVNCVKCLAK